MNQRSVGLDFLRAMAILLVMWSHSLVFLQSYAWSAFLHYKPFDGVDLFFVLSGFLIGQLLLKLMREPFTLSRWFSFISRRWLRTIPAYWFVLLVLWLLDQCDVLFAPDVRWFDYFLFVQNFNWPLIGFFWESWSLSVEEWFYAIWPASVFLFSKCVDSKRAYVLAAVAMGCASVVLRHIAFDPQWDDFAFDVHIRKVVVMRWDGIAWGLLAAFAVEHGLTLFQRKMGFWLGASLVFVLSCFDLSNQSYFKQVLSFSVSSMGMALCLPWVAQWSAVAPFWERLWYAIAKLSYALYLVNLTLVIGLMDKLWGGELQQAGWMGFAFFWTASIALAGVLHHSIERPFLRLRDRLLP